MATKSIHSLVLDAGPIIKGEPSVSTLLQQCEELVCSPAVIAEIRDQTTRARIETMLKPFLTLRSPKTDSIRVIADFAKRTGDYAILSRTDVELLALAYEIECERNNGDWRLRKAPGQARINGAPPPTVVDTLEEQSDKADAKTSTALASGESADSESSAQASRQQQTNVASSDPVEAETSVVESLLQLSLNEEETQDPARTDGAKVDASGDSDEHDTEADDSDGWITPSNIKRKQLEEDKAAASGASEPKIMQVAMITTDFAMQNVLLQMNLNLLSPSLQRVKHIKTFILRCHACFTQVRDMTKQFCPRCGGDTLTRVTCSTNAKGEFQLHFKKNFQWNNRGAKYSIPKPVHGASNHRVKGGGKGGWGNDLILSEDQKEYMQAVDSSRREKKRDLMDEDHLPSILSGSRSGQGSRIKVGAGKHVNSKKR